MFRLLSDIEVALNELLVACRESVDHYRDAAELVGQADIAERFLDIAKRRTLFLNRLVSAIRELGDLPSTPDPDKETGEITKTMKYKDGVAKVVYEKPMADGKVEEIHTRMKQNIQNLEAELDRLLKVQRTQELNVYVNKAVDVLFDVLLQNKMVDTEKFKKEDFHRLFVSNLTEEKAAD